MLDYIILYQYTKALPPLLVKLNYIVMSIVTFTFSLNYIIDPGVASRNRKNQFQHQDIMFECEKCFTLSSENYTHCNKCNVCVEKHSHHCAFVSKCIGKNNFYLFFAFVISISSFYTLILMPTLYYAGIELHVFSYLDYFNPWKWLMIKLLK